MKARETLFAQLRKQGAWNPQAVADDVRRMCLGVEYGARKAAVDAKVTFRKYSAGARLAGAWGYYAPSEVWLHAYTGRRRGCLVDAPEDSLDSYIYEYDGAGQLLRILFPARNVATYCLQNEAGGLYVTYKGYLYAAEAGLAGAVLWENDEAGRKKTLLAVTWMVDDVRVTRMEAEIYRPLCRDRALCDCIAYDANFRCAPPQAPWMVCREAWLLAYRGTKIMRMYALRRWETERPRQCQWKELKRGKSAEEGTVRVNLQNLAEGLSGGWDFDRQTGESVPVYHEPQEDGEWVEQTVANALDASRFERLPQLNGATLMLLFLQARGIPARKLRMYGIDVCEMPPLYRENHIITRQEKELRQRCGDLLGDDLLDGDYAAFAAAVALECARQWCVAHKYAYEGLDLEGKIAEIDAILALLDENQPPEAQHRGIELAKRVKTTLPFAMPWKHCKKNRWENCAKVVAMRTDEQIRPYLNELLEWIQDPTCPGALRIFERLLRYRDVELLRMKLRESILRAEATGEFGVYVLYDLMARLPVEA